MKMNKAEKRFLRCAVLAVFVMLTLLLGIINAINFSMAARDADEITERIARERGAFAPDAELPQMPEQWEPSFGRMGPMGPSSPEMRASVRFFTVAFDEDGSAETVSFFVSAISEEEAVSWAEDLKDETTGWTHGTYRYRVYRQNDKIFVTVIDQGRELLPAYRILIFSIGGTLLGTLLSFLVLRLVGKKLFAPIEEADRKQKQFIANAEKEFALPLTVISADAELLERENGSSDHTRSIHRQVRRLNGLVRSLGTLSVSGEKQLTRTPISLSDLLQELADRSQTRFDERAIRFDCEIEENVSLDGAPEAMQQALGELTENMLKYAAANAKITLGREKERIRLCFANDTQLPAGSYDQAFDRFTLLPNALDGSVGLGLAYVKDVVKAHNGRCKADVSDGCFRVTIDL